MKKRLTEVAVQKLAPDPTQRIEIYDVVATGLMLRVTKNGRKSWSVMYRVAGASLDGKRGPLRRMTIGGYPLLDLKAARSGCRKIVELADSGIDPVEQRKGTIEGRNIRRFDLVLGRFIELYAKVHIKKWQDTERLLRATAGEYWRGTDIQDIDRSRVHAFLDGQIEQRGQTYVREIRKHLA